MGLYINKSFDLNFGGTVGDFGYCQTEADQLRIVSVELRCPGCTDKLGMGELRSRMISGNLAVRYKFANDLFLKQDSKIAPYIFAGAGLNQLTDNMGKQCVNVGTHLSINGGAGLKYNISDRFNIAYSLNVGCFVTKKVYATSVSAGDLTDRDEDVIKMEKRKDLYLQNSITIGINLF